MSLGGFAVAALAFTALALASGAFAQAESSETPEELAGDVEPFDDSGDDEWGEFDEWEEEDGDGSGGKAFAFQLGGFVEGLTGARVVRSSASANEFTAVEARFRLNLDATHEIASARFRGDVFADAVEGRCGSTSETRRSSSAVATGST